MTQKELSKKKVKINGVKVEIEYNSSKLYIPAHSVSSIVVDDKNLKKISNRVIFL